MYRCCLSVCLLATSRKNFWTDLHAIFSEGWRWASEQMIEFWSRSGSRIRIATLVRRALAEVGLRTVPMLLVIHFSALLSPAMGHWDTCPIDFQQFNVSSRSLYSCTNFDDYFVQLPLQPYLYSEIDSSCGSSVAAIHESCLVYYYRTQWTAEGSVFGAVSLWVFVCVWNISGTAERICAKFTRKTCLVHRSDEFKDQGQRSRSPGTKTAFFGLSATCVRFMFGKTSLASNFASFYVRQKVSFSFVPSLLAPDSGDATGFTAYNEVRIKKTRHLEWIRQVYIIVN